MNIGLWLEQIRALVSNVTGGHVDLPESIYGMALVLVGGPLLVKLLSMIPWDKVVAKMEVVLKPTLYGAGVAISFWLVKVFGKYGQTVEDFFQVNIKKAVALLYGWFCEGLDRDDTPAPATPAMPAIPADPKDK